MALSRAVRKQKKIKNCDQGRYCSFQEKEKKKRGPQRVPCPCGRACRKEKKNMVRSSTKSEEKTGGRFPLGPFKLAL
ncbi:hypothetical protein NDU88_003583 [Pleurodeles waltl]|uniref:Uncharacterized protein n=1 Tax=Pleurodeles waltl TaxID=8319 RepID=A0AAV7QDG8_PLEWA|nr:hypothetical protein NDU88_003583 [Pleurodeles waltl]